EENDPGDPATIYNEIRIGTFSGQGPEKDVVVEILDYEANDIGGLYYEATDQAGVTPEPIALFGGPSGGAIIEEIPPDQLGGLNYAINALATDSAGTTYGLTSGGLLVRTDTTLGTIDEIIGTIIDTDSPFTPFDVMYSGFESATFAKDSSGVDVLYAVVTAPTMFNTLGELLLDSYGSVLITIDVQGQLVDGSLIAEAEPVGRDYLDRAYYVSSEVVLPQVLPDEVTTTDISTIVFSREFGDNASMLTDEPVFLGFSPENDRFVKIIVDEAESGLEVTVTTIPFAEVENEAGVVQGLMYDAQDQLYGLYDEGIGDNGQINNDLFAFVDLYADPTDRFSEITEYGTNPADNDIYLTGMSFDSLNNVGYATDPRSGTLYLLNVGRMELVDSDYIIRGLSDIFMVYIAESTADTYITFTRLDASSDPMHYTPAQGESAKLFIDEDNTLIATPEG
ncbi:MAG: hypothetical protein KAT56_09825, partial [Sedimentisphaerales bacterium]|nr:hypothetical protein [Sedimentisphaerales bacterium]